MTTGSLLWRGMIVGFVAALLSFGLVVVNRVDRAIAFRSAMDEATKAEHDAAPKAKPPPPEGTTRLSADQRRPASVSSPASPPGIAFGGLSRSRSRFFTAAWGFSPRLTAALIALGGFLAVYAVDPQISGQPPSIGNPDTIRFALRSISA